MDGTIHGYVGPRSAVDTVDRTSFDASAPVARGTAPTPIQSRSTAAAPFWPLVQGQERRPMLMRNEETGAPIHTRTFPGGFDPDGPPPGPLVEGDRGRELPLVAGARVLTGMGQVIPDAPRVPAGRGQLVAGRPLQGAGQLVDVAAPPLRGTAQLIGPAPAGGRPAAPESDAGRALAVAFGAEDRPEAAGTALPLRRQPLAVPFTG